MRRIEEPYNEFGRRLVTLVAENDKDLIEIMKLRFEFLDRELFYYRSIPEEFDGATSACYTDMRQELRYGMQMYPQFDIVEDEDGNPVTSGYVEFEEMIEDDDY